ncbi:MAG: VWA domain-containing protein [Planctomycetota bacterium]
MLGLRSLNAVEPSRRYVAIALRLAVLVVLTVMLAGIQAVRTHDELTVIAVVDQSESVRRFVQPPAGPDAAEPPTAERYVRDFLQQGSDGRRQDDRLAVVTYDGRATVRSLPTNTARFDNAGTVNARDGTDTASALRTAMALKPGESSARIVLASDGNDTDGDLIAAAREAAAAGLTIDVLPLDYRVDREVLVEGVFAPATAREGQTAAVRVPLRATRPATGVLQLLHDGEVVDLNGSAPGTGMPVREAEWTLESTDNQDPAADNPAGRFVAVKLLNVPLAFTGVNRFEAIFEPDEGTDAQPANNRGQAFTVVQGKGRVLLVDGVGGTSGAILPEALTSHGIQVDIVPPTGVPRRLTDLQRYDAVLFHNVPAEAVPGPQQRALVRYVHDLGGGFAMIGGNDGFGAGAWTNTPIDRSILPVTCQIPSQTILPSGALVLVIDRSGSMGSTVAGTSKTQMEIAAEAAALALATLYPQDLVGIVALDSTAKLIHDVRPNDDPAGVAAKLRSLQPGGGTNIYNGLELAYQRLGPLTVQDAAIKHMILLTDGHEPGGNYVRLFGQMRAAGITLSSVGIGDGHDAQLLARLASMGGGQYHAVIDPTNLPQVFIKEAKTIRKNLIREVPFQPTLINDGSPVTASLGAVPELRGFVLTGRRDDPRIYMPIVGPEDEPIFAHWQVGLGRSAAFTSDATNRWATNWLQWGGYSDFWARTVRLIAKPAAARDLDLAATVDNGRLQVRLDAAGADQAGAERSAAPGNRRNPRGGSFGNFMEVQGTVITPDGQTRPIALDQTGPGLYEVTDAADLPGNYVVSLMVTRPDGSRSTVVTGASRPVGEELRKFTSDRATLQRVADITGGRLLDPNAPDTANLFDRAGIAESRSVRPLWRPLLWLLIGLVMLDVANRRIAWDGPALARATSERAAALAAALKPTKVESTESVGALRTARQRATTRTQSTPDATQASTQAGAERSAAPGTPRPSPNRQTPKPPNKKRKFEAAPSAQASDDFATAVGGASENSGNAKLAAIAGARKTEKAAEQEQSAMSRLRAAKRAASERLREEGES